MRRGNRLRIDSPEALAELYRRHYESPEEKCARIAEWLGIGENDSKNTYTLPEAENIAKKLPTAFFHSSRNYQKIPSQSLSTRKNRGDRARLVYAPQKRRWRDRRGFYFKPQTEWELQRKKKLKSPRNARFSKTFDSRWKGTSHEQITFFLDSLGSYDTLLGISALNRAPERARSATKSRKPNLYYEASAPFYYALDAHEEVFRRSWSHAVQAALAVQANRQNVIWPRVEWRIGKSIELCRTPLPMAKVCREDGTVMTYTGTEGEGAEEVVRLECVPAVDKFYTIFNKNGDPIMVSAESPYAETPRFQIVIKRVTTLEDENEEKLRVNVLGSSSIIRLDIDTAVRIAEALPEWFENLQFYFADHKDQDWFAQQYLHHPWPSRQKWGFVNCDFLKSRSIEEVFDTEREEALLHSPELYEGDSPRFRDGDKNGKWSLARLHPLYLIRLSALARSELKWRDSWQVEEATAYEDAERVEKFLNTLRTVLCWVYVFCKALFLAVLKARPSNTSKRGRVIIRQSLDGLRLLKLVSCRGPPPFLSR